MNSASSRATAAPAPQPSAIDRWLPWLLGAVALLPLLCNLTEFRTLFYFEDELVLIDEWDKTGFRAWAFSMFTESWVPLFKVIWGGVIRASGSYFLLVCLLWLNHALNVALLAKLVRRCGAGAWAAVFAGVLLGLPWSNIETLGWVVQWTAVMSLTFFLLGLLALARDAATEQPRELVLGALLLVLSFLSAACFIRGILTGTVLAGVVLFSRPERSWWRRLLLATAAFLPTLAVIGIIFGNGQGNHQHLTAQLAAKVQFGYTYFVQAPFRWIAGVELIGTPWFHLVAVGKLALYAAGLALASRRWRMVVAGCLLYELGNVVLLGIGRFHTGLPAAASWRYQYTALLMLAPASGIVFEWLVGRLIRAPRVRFAVAAAAVVAFALHVAWPWKREMGAWKGWRGGDFRAGLAAPIESAPPNFSRLPWIDNARTRELVKKYNLH